MIFFIIVFCVIGVHHSSRQYIGQETVLIEVNKDADKSIHYRLNLESSNLNKNMTKKNNSTKLVKSGCCSYHGGESKCDTSIGKIVCKDGTYSPTCKCLMYDPSTQNNNSNWQVQVSCPINSTYNTLTNQCECNTGYELSTKLGCFQYKSPTVGSNTSNATVNPTEFLATLGFLFFIYLYVKIKKLFKKTS